MLQAGMEYCRVNNANVGDFYDLDDEANKYMYWQTINTPVYSTIAKEIRGKAICK